MTCPDTGTWRAWLDEEAAVPAAEAHLSACGDCTRELARLRDDAAYATTVVALLDPPAAAGTTAAATPTHATATPLSKGTRRTGTSPQWMTAAAAALVAVMVIATPGGRAAAGDFLALFRSERVALLAVDEPSLTETGAVLDMLGDAENIKEPEPVEVAGLADAIERTGLPVTAPDPATLPGGTATTPVVRVTDEQQLRFTFSAAATREYLAQFDDADRPLPAGYDGATLMVNVPPGVLQVYRGPDEMPAVLVGHAGTVTASVEGDVDLETLRAFLLELPGLPESVVGQLALIDDWRTTLPIPVPIDEVGGEETTVDGAEAILVRQEGFGTGLLWQRDGVVIGVAGILDEPELRAVVDSLRAP